MATCEIDLPHDSAAIEWWYVNGHLHTDSSPERSPPFSFSASFFQLRHNPRRAPGSVFSWVIIDTRKEDDKRYYTDSVLDSHGIAGLEVSLQNSKYELDKLLSDALVEELKKGNMPGPDRFIPVPAKVSKNHPFAVHFGDIGHFTRDDVTGNYKLVCENPHQNMMLELEFKPQRNAAQQTREDFVVHSISKLEISGKLSVTSLENKDTKETFGVNGSGWYQHGFGGEISEIKEHGLKYKHLEHWFSLQLSNNTQISASHMLAPETKNLKGNMAIIFSDPNLHKEYPDLVLQDLSEKGKWMSMRTTLSYSTKWRLIIPSAKVDLLVVAAMDSQEFVSYTRNPALWEGRVHVTGTVDSTPVTGYGFLVMNAGLQTPTLQQFFKNITKEVLHQVTEILPLNPTFEQLCALIGTPPHYLEDIDAETVVQTVIKPLRDMIDRAGKCWRSYVVMLCIDCVGGDSNKYRKLMAVPEIAQTGSLIIDDIQDKSEIRRGGPSCHKMYGEAIAINVGIAAFFIALSPEQKVSGQYQLKIEAYNHYFSATRAACVGQGLDLKGFEHLMPEAIKSGDNSRILSRIRSCYLLKTAAPSSFCARLGAIIGGGTPNEISGLTKYFEVLAFAFQIMDDVLNLRGFTKQAKTRGEDITEGKITYPIALAMSSKLVPTIEGRQSIFDRLKSKPNPPFYAQKVKEIEIEISEKQATGPELDKLQEEYQTNKKSLQQNEEILQGLIEELETCGAIEEANQISQRMMESAWQELDEVLPNTRYKILLRAFGKMLLKGFYF